MCHCTLVSTNTSDLPNASFSPKAKTGTRLAPVSIASLTNPLRLAMSCVESWIQSARSEKQCFRGRRNKSLQQLTRQSPSKPLPYQQPCAPRPLTTSHVPGAASRASAAPPGTSMTALPGPLQGGRRSRGHRGGRVEGGGGSLSRPESGRGEMIPEHSHHRSVCVSSSGRILLVSPLPVKVWPPPVPTWPVYS